jgi:hypothetical protein
MNYIKSVLPLLILVLSCMVIVSCKKDQSLSYGIPKITKVEQPTDTTSITNGSFEQWIKIYGTNLASAETVTLNDQVVSDSIFYANDTTVTLMIPRSIPQKVTNTITIVTKGGTATYTFVVSVPAFQFTGMFNEYTPIGDTMTLTGANFDLYDFTALGTSVTFTGGATATVIKAMPKALTLVVPSGAKEGPITIKGAAPLNVSATSSGWYKDSRNFLFSMNPYTGWNGTSYISTGSDPIPINGPYFKVAKSWSSGWAWDPFLSNNCNIPAALVASATLYKNYAIKFEMYTPISGPALPLKLYMVFNSGNFKEFFYDAGNGAYPFSTGGKWETFTVPLSSWGNLGGFTFSSTMIMEFMLKDGNASVSNFSICNFRMVPM